MGRGYIEAASRESDKIIKFPVMSISLAGDTNVNRKIESYAELTNIAAEIKGSLKRIKGSKLLVDRRAVDLGIEYRGRGSV